jgi:Ca2+-dependent lipid-binding protein
MSSGKREQTKVVQNTKQPMWNEKFIFRVRDINESVRVSVLDKDVM